MGNAKTLRPYSITNEVWKSLINRGKENDG